MIRKLQIRNFLALSAQTFDFDPAGALIAGGNGRGKSTVLKAIKAALDGAGISPEAVRKGESAAEILVDLDHDTVRRRITSNGATTLTIEDAAGSTRKKPAAFLAELLGLALLDPLDLFLAKAGARRELVLRAVPCVVTPAMLVPHLPAGYTLTAADCEGHGLDVVDRQRRAIAERRTTIGRTVKEREGEAKAASAAADLALKAAGAIAGRPSREAAAASLWTVTQRKADVDARVGAAERSAKFVAGRRARAEELREQASGEREAAPLAPNAQEIAEALSRESEANEAHGRAIERCEEQNREILRIREMLRDAEEEKASRVDAADRAAGAMGTAQAARYALQQREEAAQEAFDRAAALDEQAQRELDAIAEIGAEPPPIEEVATIETERLAALRVLEEAHEAERLTAAATAAIAVSTAKAAELKTLREQHAALDRAVKALANDLPRELLAGAGGLSGLTIEGDTILVDDGKGALVDVEQLSTAAQMRFALSIAKRLNERSKILLVDGLERLDAEHLRDFVSLAIEDGYQLFATRVTDGPLHVSPIGGAS